MLAPAGVVTGAVVVGGAKVEAGAAVVTAQQRPQSQSVHATAPLFGMNASISNFMDQHHRVWHAADSHSKHLSICFW